MTESKFWYRFRKVLKSNGIRFQRFEDSLSEGIPDLCLFINGKTVWVELKCKKLPKRPTTIVKVGLRPLQRIWARQRRKDKIAVFTVSLLLHGNGNEEIMVHSNEVVDELYSGMVYKRLEFTGTKCKNEKELVELFKKRTGVKE